MKALGVDPDLQSLLICHWQLLSLEINDLFPIVVKCFVSAGLIYLQTLLIAPKHRRPAQQRICKLYWALLRFPEVAGFLHQLEEMPRIRSRFHKHGQNYEC